MVKALLNIKPLSYCGSCDKVLLEEHEIAEDDLKEQSIVVTFVTVGTIMHARTLH